MSAGLIEFLKTYFPRNIWMYNATFFRNLVTLLNLQHLIDYQLDFPLIANFLQLLYFPRRVIFFLTQRFTCTPIQNPYLEQLMPYWWLRRAKQLSTAATQLCWSSISVVVMSCKVKSFYVVRSALLLCLSLQIFAGMYSWGVYVLSLVGLQERCVITQMHRRLHWSVSQN